MKVAELIERLSALDPTLDVDMRIETWNGCESAGVEDVVIKEYLNATCVELTADIAELGRPSEV